MSFWGKTDMIKKFNQTDANQRTGGVMDARQQHLYDQDAYEQQERDDEACVDWTSLVKHQSDEKVLEVLQNYPPQPWDAPHVLLKCVEQRHLTSCVWMSKRYSGMCGGERFIKGFPQGNEEERQAQAQFFGQLMNERVLGLESSRVFRKWMLWMMSHQQPLIVDILLKYPDAKTKLQNVDARKKIFAGSIPNANACPQMFTDILRFVGGPFVIKWCKELRWTQRAADLTFEELDPKYRVDLIAMFDNLKINTQHMRAMLDKQELLGVVGEHNLTKKPKVM